MYKSRVFYLFIIVGLWSLLTGVSPYIVATAPGAFVKVSPTSGSINQPTTITLTWNASTGATAYEYCLRTNTNCSNKWVNIGSLTSITVSGLSPNTKYYWQVRATDSTGDWTYADGSDANRWDFTTQPLPGAFGKTTPVNGATDQPISGLVLNWSASANANFYEYCIDDTNNNTCNTAWISTGATPSATVNNLAPSKLLYWQVRAINNSGTIYANANVWWSFTTVSALPGSFNKLLPIDAAQNQPVNNLTVSWESSLHAISYRYCIDEVNNNTCDTGWTNNGLSTSASVSGLNYGATYYWQVQSVNTDGTVDANGGMWWSFQTQIAPPAAFGKTSPINNAVALDPIGLILTWGTSVGATGYEYCYDTTNDNACATWTSVSSTSSGPLTLNYGLSYYWQVRALNSTGVVSANNGVYWVFSTRLAPPGAFNKVVPPNSSTTTTLSPVLGWTTSAGVNVSYEYCYDTVNNGVCDGIWALAGNDTTVPLSGLQYATVYYWQARAVNSTSITYADNGTWWSFTTPVAPPGAFGKENPQNEAVGIVNTPTLTWSTSPGADRYEYCYDTTDDDACTGWTSVTTTSSEPLLLTYGMTYYWQVRSVNSQGVVDSDQGDWWSFTVIGAAPSGFSKINPIDGAEYQQLTPWLYWSTSENATGYEYCIDMSDDTVCDTGWVTVGDARTSVQVTAALVRNTNYFWQVRATGTTPVQANGGDWWSFRTLPQPPTVDPGGNAFTVPEDTLLNGNLSANNPSGLSLSYWLVDPKPSGLVALNIDGSFTYQPVPNISGVFTFYFMIADGVNIPQGPFPATIQVSPVNDAPVMADIADQSVRTGKNITFAVSATDADIPYGDSLVFSILEPLPPGAVFDAGVFSWTPVWTNLHKAPYTFTFVVTDSALPVPATDQQVVLITVIPEKVFLPLTVR